MSNKNWKESIIQRLGNFPGRITFYYKDLTTGKAFGYQEDQPVCAASVIKLTIMAELFRQMEAGELDGKKLIAAKESERVPICGVLTLMHDGIQVTPEDLCWLMITISDNMATNLLIDLLGLEKIQAHIRALGLEGVELNRKMFERRPGLREKTNYVTAAGIGKLLESIYLGELVSKKASQKMLEMLLAQQCSNKIPLLLSGQEGIAHKTGEDEGITHDVGILLTKRPCVICFCNEKIHPGDEGKMNLLIAEIAQEIWNEQGGAAEEV